MNFHFNSKQADSNKTSCFKFYVKKNFKNFMVPFYGWGSTASRLEPL